MALNITVTKTIAVDPSSFTLHRVLRGWGGGTGINPNSGTGGSSTGAPAKSGEATWQARFHPNLLWSVPGAAAAADFSSPGSATQDIGSGGSYSFESTPDLVADVQNWFTNTAGNFGWILICDDEATPGTARRFGSREDSANAPSLVLQYSQPTPPHVTLTPVADTSLFELNPNNNLGASTLVAGTIGLNEGARRSRALIQFSLSNLPPDIVLTSAALTINVVKQSFSAANSNFDLHRVLQPWGEGNKAVSTGAPASAGEATWNARFFLTSAWNSPGASSSADVLPTVSSTTFISGGGPFVFSGLLADVQFWLDHPQQNFGWILMTESESVPYTARRFGSREDALNTPTLTLGYVARPRITQSQVVGNKFTLSFIAQAGQGYLVQARNSLSSGNWGTLTNVPPPSSTQTIVVNAPIAGTQRFYRIVLP